MPRFRLVAIVLVPVLLLAACGSDDDAADGVRVVDVSMQDIAFSVDQIDVSKGETVTFRFTNDGALVHDAFIGDAAAQDEHGAEMADMGGMDHGNDDGDAITVDPGETGEITYTFDTDGPILIGCHEPAHYGAGMVFEVAVS